MSARREARESESRRRRSRFDEEPSPKRSRRDGKRETERRSAKSDLDHKDRSGGDQKHRRRLQDAVPLEAPAEQASDSVALSKDSEKSNVDARGTNRSDPTGSSRSRASDTVAGGKDSEKSNVDGQGTKHSDPTGAFKSQARSKDSERSNGRGTTHSDPNGASRSQARSKDSEKSNVDGRGTKHSDPVGASRSRQRDDRGNAEQVGRRFGRTGDSARVGKWNIWQRDQREHQSDRRSNISTGDLAKKGEQNSKDKDESGKADKVGEETPWKQNSKEPDRPDAGKGHSWRGPPHGNQQNGMSRRDGWRSPPYGNQQHGVSRRDGWRRPPYGNQQNGASRREGWRSPPLLPSRDNYGHQREGVLGMPVRDGSSSIGSVGPPPTGKWKHDLYDEASKSPGPKNEENEDAVAKVEALLAS